MRSKAERYALAGAVVLAGAALAAQAQACNGAGVITRIDGKPQDVVISRVDAGKASVVTRPRVLEVICTGDDIRLTGPSSVTLSVDGRGTVKVAAGASYKVPARSGAPTVAGNAYRTLNDQVMPDMKRLAWNVRLKGEGDDFGFRLQTLATGGQKITAGSRSLLVRLTGGTGPYKVALKDGSGKVLASGGDAEGSVVLGAASLAPGSYELSASDSTPRTMTAKFEAVAGAAPSGGDFSGMPDAEVRAASAATALAQAHPGAWGFEAEQILAAAPASGLDRDRVYELVESYGDQ
jgi:hypothetical protein